MEPDNMLAQKEFAFRLLKLIRPIDVVVILSSIVSMYLFRIQDGYQLKPIWQLQRNFGGQPSIQVQPLITDLDGDGLKELIIASKNKIEIFSFHADEFDDDSHASEKDDTSGSVLYHLHQKNKLSYSEIDPEMATKYPVAINSGCNTISHKEICSQVLAIVWDDWTITLLSHHLKILWRSKPMNLTFSPKLQISEIGVLVAAGNKTIFGENGLVIVGGVLNVKDHKTASHSTEHDHSQLHEINKTAEEISREHAGVGPSKDHSFSHDLDPTLAKYIGHLTSYALDVATGNIVWKHEPGDFEAKRENNEEHYLSHFKLRLKKKALHPGEVHWKKYSHSFLKHLPFSWVHNSETAISLGEFTRTVASKISEQPGENTIEQLMAFAKTGLPKEEKMPDFNTVVIRNSRGIEVLDLEKGSPVCFLPLESKFSALGDVNGDEHIDLVKFHVYQESSKPVQCFVVVSNAFIASSILFNSSICDTDDYFGDVIPSVNKSIKSLPPLLTQTLKRSFGFLHHVSGYGLSHQNVGMDIILLTSTGKLSAFGPSGWLLWEVDTGFTWSETDFTPSMTAISLSVDETKDGVIILGPNELMVISLVDGSILTTHSLPCVSTAPLILGDINNDIIDEFLIHCNDRYIALSLERYNRIGLTLLVYSGIACVVGFVLFIIKFTEREDFPFDTFDYVMKGVRYFPLQGSKL